MANDTVFKPGIDKEYFRWNHIPPIERVYWNYLLRRVVEIDANGSEQQNPDYIIDSRSGDKLNTAGAGTACPNFYNQDFCLALTICPDDQREKTEGIKETPVKPVNKGRQLLSTEQQDVFQALPPVCLDFKDGLADIYPYIVKPHFNYHRKDIKMFKMDQSSSSQTQTPAVLPGFNTNSLTIGSLVWLYFYERMGIFKILGVLLDDYNYRGKYSFSSQVRNNLMKNKQYIDLMEHLSLLTRQGAASTLRDRVSTYQRVLGVTVQNDLNVQSYENNAFMKNFSKLISNMLEYYNAKRLAVALNNNYNGGQIRSSVATQTAILNTIKVLCQNFEVMEYGRNMIHTYLGIATVYTTLCLIKQIRDVIGIPREYDTPEEYIPAAYDILVLKKQGASSDTNRYTVFDNCASYGYRLLTDVQLVALSGISLGDQNTPFDAWLSSVEEWVEGYNNAFKSIPDKNTSETAVATA